MRLVHVTSDSARLTNYLENKVYHKHSDERIAD